MLSYTINKIFWPLAKHLGFLKSHPEALQIACKELAKLRKASGLNRGSPSRDTLCSPVALLHGNPEALSGFGSALFRIGST